MNIINLKQLNPMIKAILKEAAKVYEHLAEKEIKVNQYHPFWALKGNTFEKVIMNPQRIINHNDKYVLSLYLGLLKVESPLQAELNKMGVTYDAVLNHFGLKEEIKQAKAVNNRITNLNFNSLIINMITANEGITSAKPSEARYINYIHECLQQPVIVKSQIVNDLLMEMAFYETLINEFDQSQENETNEFLDQYINQTSTFETIDTSNQRLIDYLLKDLIEQTTLNQPLPKEEKQNTGKILEFKRKHN